MSRRAFILFVEPGRHRACAAGDEIERAEVSAGPDATPEQFADAAAAALASLGYAGEGVLLAVPSAWCLCAAVRLDDLPARGGRRAMAYRLEEKLPVSAEEVVADFIATVDGATALGVCVEKKTLAPVVEALEARGAAVEAIAPASLLALQHLLGDSGSAPGVGDADVILWPAGEGSLELFTLRHGLPRSWALLPNEPKDLLLQLGLTPRDRPEARTVVAVGLAQPLLEALTGLPGVCVIEQTAAAPDASAAATARAVAAGDALLWVNLRRDDLALRDALRAVRTPLTLAAAAVVLCLVSLCGAMLWRAHRYDRLAAAYAGEQRAAFAETFPGQAVPLDIASRLASEERALRGVSGGDASAPPPESPGLLILRDLLAHLPGDVRYRVLDLRLDGGRFTVEGQALSHGDADAIAASLRRHGGFEVEPPRTEQLADSSAAGTGHGAAAGDGAGASAVSFTITGSVSAQEETAAGGRASP